MSARNFGSELLNPRYGGDQTPIMHTPNPYEHGGQSVISRGGWSPAAAGNFTPMYSREMSFTPIRSFDAGMSPNMMRNTPVYNPNFGGQTPIAGTPIYHTLQSVTNMSSPMIGNSSSMYRGYGTSEVRTPMYRNLGNSSSPSYSDMKMSQSPSYSPASSHHSSPSYSARGAESNR